jgi:hypothetical protein
MNQQRKVFVILGKTGSGKSTLARSILDKFSRIITLDPLGEYEGNIITSWRVLVDTLEPLYDNWGNEHFNISCRFTTDEDVEYLFRLMWELHDVLFVVEETEIYLDPRKPNKAFSRLINYGRHRHISLLCVARRVPELSVQLRSQATSIITFRQSEPRDLQLLELYGFNQEAVKTLGDYEYLGVGESI